MTDPIRPPVPDGAPNNAAEARTCSVDTCNRVHYCRGWCRRHYERWMRNGTTDSRNPHLPAPERFATKYQVDAAGCWLWTSTLTTEGYADFWDGGKNVLGHRWSYEHHIGPIPDGLHLDHLCRVTRCVNPDHLDPVTAAVNVLRGTGPSARNAAKTHCIHGHPLSGDNLAIVSTTGERRCRACCRIRDAKYRAARA